MLALAKLAIQPNMHPLSSLITSDARIKITDNAYPVFASVTWATVMYIWRWHPETLASSLRSSMVYMYVSPYLIYPRVDFRKSERLRLLLTGANIHFNHSYGDSDHWDSLRTLLLHNK